MQQLRTQSLCPLLQVCDQHTNDEELVIKSQLSCTGIYFVDYLSPSYKHTYPATTTLAEGEEIFRHEDPENEEPEQEALVLVDTEDARDHTALEPRV